MNQCSVNTGVVFTFILSELIRQPQVVAGGINECKDSRTFYMPSLGCADNLKYETERPNQTNKSPHPVTESYHF